MPEPNEWSDFLLWETASRDTIDFKTIYVDMADDLIAGLLLSQIIFWYLPAKDGTSKLRVYRDNYYWIAKAREDWWDEIRISPKQADRAFKILREMSIVITEYHRFNGLRTMHIWLQENVFLEKFEDAIKTEFNNPYFPKGKNRC